MALTDGDREWLQGLFNAHGKKLDEFKDKFSEHVTADALVANHLESHIAEYKEQREKETERRKRGWKFWTAILLAVIGALATAAVEHWTHK